MRRIKDEIDFEKSQFATSQNDELTQDNLKSQFVISSWGGKRKLPYAFTEQGIYMLATVLRGELAEQQSIFIMRAFREIIVGLKILSKFFFFCLISPFVRNTKHFTCDSFMTSNIGGA